MDFGLCFDASWLMEGGVAGVAGAERESDAVGRHVVFGERIGGIRVEEQHPMAPSRLTVSSVIAT